jgi:hypothetical protein
MGFSTEAPMNKPLLLAVMVAALPACATAQEAKPGTPPGQAPSPPGCAGLPEAPRASSALPARASTRPAPQLGAVARSAWVPSHAETPSLRAMRAAKAREAGQAGNDADCPAETVAPGTKAEENRR